MTTPPPKSLTPDERARLEERWQEINSKVTAAEAAGVSPIGGVDLPFYVDVLLEELEEIEYALGMDDFASRPH